MNARVLVGDCLLVMPTLDAESVDAVVCDPPYGLKFMGKAWDSFTAGDSPMRRTPERDAVNAGASRQGGRQRACSDYQKRQSRDMAAFQEWCEAWAVECLRVAKPGAHLVAFGGTRTYHRLTCAIEDAGWEIRDCLSWLYGSGFPKSLDVSKAIDSAHGAHREIVGPATSGGTGTGNAYGNITRAPRTAPATALARQWEGWGTALKPAWEPIVLARKPLAGTVAANVLAHSTGALNIDGCRIGAEAITVNGWRNAPGNADMMERVADKAYRGGTHDGRWPANVVLDEDAAAALDEQTGELASGNHPAIRRGIGFTESGGGQNSGTRGERLSTDSGGASRFFYTAKASAGEREAGLYQFAPIRRTDGRDSDVENPRLRTSARANHHPTVKPLALMQWLCRLVTPKGGLILDPFTGSGSTGRAAVAEGFRFLGIELSEEYAEIARARIHDYAPILADGAA